MSLARIVESLLVGVLLLAVPADAWAYLDPGTGSYVFQLAVAGLFAGMATLKIYHQRIKNWISARKAPALPGPDDPKAT